MKKIKFKLKNRSSGLGMVNDQLWNEWMKLENGIFEDNGSEFILKTTDNQEYIINKSGELIVTKMYNRFLSTDKKIFEVYEGKNPSGGYFILYRFKDENRRNEFVIATTMGLASGSSIAFELDEITQFSDNNKKPSIDLADYKFLSDDHTRIQNGNQTIANNKGAWRGIRIKSFDNQTFYVTMYNMNGNHPIWGDNIQMAEKQMKMLSETTDKIVLQGFGTDAMGASFADYGLTLHKLNGKIDKISLHMHDRNIDIIYKKAKDEKQKEIFNNFSDFDNFKEFTHQWNTSISIQEKLEIAMKSDALNNKGAYAYNNGDIEVAISYFEQALKLMPNNDDALKNLKICYSKVGNYSKVNEVEKKLNYLA